MAHQNLPEAYLFMSKEIFDQVSAVMWGYSDLDYHTHYISTRMQWNDSDIREETLYSTGLAHGLRLAALQEASKPIRHQSGHRDQSSDWWTDEGGCQFGCTSQCDPRYGKHYCYTPPLSDSMAQSPPKQSSQRVLYFKGVPRAPVEITASHRRALMVNHRSAPPQDSWDHPHREYGTEPPSAKTFSSSQLTLLGMAPRPPHILPTETEVPGMKLPGNLKAVYRNGEGIVAVSGTPASPDGSNVLPSLSDSPESQLRAEIPLHQKPQSPAAARNDSSIGDTTVRNQSGLRLDEECAKLSIQSSDRESAELEGAETDEGWINL